MPVWKVLLILALAIVCMALGMATIAIPIAQVGAMKWVWLAGLLTATLGTGALLAFFLRYAGASLDVKPRGGHR
jgi:hypothetical protein